MNQRFNLKNQKDRNELFALAIQLDLCEEENSVFVSEDECVMFAGDYVEEVDGEEMSRMICDLSYEELPSIKHLINKMILQVWENALNKSNIGQEMRDAANEDPKKEN